MGFFFLLLFCFCFLFFCFLFFVFAVSVLHLTYYYREFLTLTTSVYPLGLPGFFVCREVHFTIFPYLSLECAVMTSNFVIAVVALRRPFSWFWLAVAIFGIPQHREECQGNTIPLRLLGAKFAIRNLPFATVPLPGTTRIYMELIFVTNVSSA